MRTHSNLLMVLLLVGFGILYSCNSRTNNANNTAETRDTAMNHSEDMAATDNAAAPMTDTMGQANMDTEALMLVMTTDMNEINAATEAQKRKLSKPAMDYAKMMITEHTTNLEKGKTLSQSMQMPMDTAATVTALKQKGADMLATLTPLKGKAFEQAYIDGMIKDHQDALSMLDNQLIPAAKNEMLKNHLTATRGHVAMHLERAQQIKASM